MKMRISLAPLEDGLVAVVYMQDRGNERSPSECWWIVPGWVIGA